mgnify:CR=1 FL=1
MTRWWGLALVVGLAACHRPARGLAEAPDATLRTAAEVGWWEERIRPDRLQLLAGLLADAIEEADKCRVTPTEQCREISGRATMRVEGGERRAMRLRGWQYQEVRLDGRAVVDTNMFTFDLRLEILDRDDDGPQWWAVQIEGTRDAAGHWRAEGDAAAQGHGRVHVRVEELDVSEACKAEPWGGVMYLRSGASEAVVRYDGATACDEKGVATWTLDGQPQGDVDVAGALRCAVGSGRGRAPVGLGLLVVLALGRRRRAR